jgi:tellurite resistance protein
VPKDSKLFADREKSLEDQFFARQSQELKRKLREKQEREQTRKELRRIAVVTDEQTIDRMIELGIGADTWAAISLVPLVEVAWADGKIDKKERQAVMAAAEANGVMPGSPAHQILSGWLEHRPDARLLGAWGEYIVELCAAITPEEKHRLRDELLQRARSVAEQAGGFLGLGNKISPEEQLILDELRKAFER